MNPIIYHLLVIVLLFSCNEDDSDTFSSQTGNTSGNVTSSAPAVNGDNSAELNLLFIGNSLTYSNDLPEKVYELAINDEIAIKTTMVAKPNYALEDHISDRKIKGLIENEDYDFVIIQQGPSSQPYGRETLVSQGKIIKTYCDSSGSQLIYFMVWPSRTYYYTYNGVINNYRNGARANDALLAPVGEVWKSHFDQTADFSYYGPDGFHPSPAGTEVAAQIIWETVLENR